MTWSIRRALVVFLAIGPLGSLSAWQVATEVQIVVDTPVPVAGGPPIEANPANPGELTQTITYPTSPNLKGKVQAANDFIKDEDWEKATFVLQGLLDLKEDKFVELTDKDANGKPRTGWKSVRTEANRLLGTMPAKGLEFYRTASGGKARAELAEAMILNDPSLLAAVSLKYLYTEAGAEATDLLGTYHLDRGNYVLAALCFEKLMSRDGVDKLSPLTLFKASMAFHYAQDKENETRVMKQLEAKAPDGIRLSGQNVALSEVKNLLDQIKGKNDGVAGLYDWPMYGGTLTRSGQGKGSTPFMVARQNYSMFEFRGPLSDANAKAWVTGAAGAVKMLENQGQAVLPGFFPLATTVRKKDGKEVPMMIYRNLWGIWARNIKTGELQWANKADFSLISMANDSEVNSQLQVWIQQYGQYMNNTALIENSVTGTLSTDNSRVYMVDDLAMVPPMQMMNMNMGWGQPQGQPNIGGKIGEAINYNRLMAFDLVNGMFKWQLGGRGPKAGELADSYFLGPPLCLAGKLYVLTEKNQDLRLVCIDPSKITSSAKDQDMKDAIQWIQTLATTKDKMVNDVARRTQAAHLSYGDGILVCPTNAGAVLGVDLLTHSLVWAHPYREASPDETKGGGGMGRMRGGPWGGGVPMNAPNISDWKVTAPIIKDGKVIFAAPDGSALHCLNLRDGKFLWQAPRTENDLYLGGVHDGIVLVVNKAHIQGLKLADGKEKWKTQTGMPSGQGVASEDSYYLPLKSSSASTNKKPAVCVINIATGSSYLTKSRKEEVPGNLTFFDGDVISQTIDSVSVYPQLKIMRAQMDELLAKNPNDPVGLTKRGELYLDEGKTMMAVADLRRALENHPDPKDVLPKTNLTLYESLTELLQKDFKQAEPYLAEYEKLCQMDLPEAPSIDQRKANRLCLLAKGMESEKRLGDAFKYYMDFSEAVGGKPGELISVIDEPQVKASPDIWAQGRIAAMMNSKEYTPEQRKPVEEQISQKWLSVKSSNDLVALRRFVGTFGSLFKVGREARMQLAERLIEEPGTNTLLEAELQLHLLQQQEDPKLAARAVEATARLLTRKGLLAEAAYYYRVLARLFPEVAVHEGKTGSDLLNELATDKRFLPYLEDTTSIWRPGKMKGEEHHAQRNQNQQPVYQFESQGEPTPFFQQNRMALNINYSQLKISDRATGEERWSQRVNMGMFQQFVWAWNPNGGASFPYRHVGHFVVLNLGQMIIGLDPINRQVLWEKNLMGNTNIAGFPQMGANVYLDPNDGFLKINYQTGYQEVIGHIGPTEASYVSLLTRDGLTAFDPATGRTLWVRSSITPRSHAFGDSEHIYVVEMNKDNQPIGTRVLRACDGVEVHDVPNFAELYQRRIGMRGRNLLLTQSDKDGTMLRLYDVLTGKDSWNKKFAAGTVVLRTEDPDLAGVVDPEGRVTVFDMRSLREVLKAQMAPKHLAKVNEIHLLHDNKYFYVACNGPLDGKNPGGGFSANVQQGTGMRGISVNGEVYAFNRSNGKVYWHTQVPQQYLLVDQFGELPVLLFTARHNRVGAGGVWMGQSVSVTSIDKRTGKRVFDKTDLDGNNNQPFYALTSDAKSGKIEMVSWNYQVIFSLVEPEGGAGTTSGKDKQAKEGDAKTINEGYPKPAPPK